MTTHRLLSKSIADCGTGFVVINTLGLDIADAWCATEVTGLNTRNKCLGFLMLLNICIGSSNLKRAKRVNGLNTEI